MNHEVQAFNDARAIGMTPKQAARWVRYLASHGNHLGIGLDEAYLQCQLAADRAKRPHPQPPRAEQRPAVVYSSERADQ